MEEIVKMINHYIYSGSSFIKKHWYLLISMGIIVIFITIYKKIESIREEGSSPPIHSLFYQPLLKDKINWDVTFQKLHQVEVKKLILQWSKFGVVDFVKDDKWLKEILSYAQKYNIEVIVGLYGDDNYFKILESRNSDIKLYLSTLHSKNIKQAEKVYTIAKNYSSFNGYYIYDEVDDTNFIEKERQKYLKEYLQVVSNSIAKISKHPLYISGYFSKNISPNNCAKLFSEITQKKYTLFLQSGIGAGLVDNNTSSIYMQTFRKEFKGEFIPLVEGFRFKGSTIEATDFTTLKREIELIKKSTNTSKLALFSLRYFLDKNLFDAYLLKYSKTNL